MHAEAKLLLADGYADGSASKCNGLIRGKELEPWVGDGATNEDGLEAIEDSAVDGFDKNEVVCWQFLLLIRRIQNFVFLAERYYFTFGLWHRRSVCCLSVICNMRAPYSAD